MVDRSSSKRFVSIRIRLAVDLLALFTHYVTACISTPHPPTSMSTSTSTSTPMSTSTTVNRATPLCFKKRNNSSFLKQKEKLL